MRDGVVPQKTLLSFTDVPKLQTLIPLKSQKTEGILLVILFPRDPAADTALDSQDVCAFNDGMCEALFSAFGDDQQYLVRFLRLQRGHCLHLWYIGKRKRGFLRNHAIPQCTFLTPVGNRGITPCVCVKEPSRSRGVIPTAGGLYGHQSTVCCRNIRRHIQRYWILRRLCRSISC